MTQATFNVLFGVLIRGVIILFAGILVDRGLLPQGNYEEWVAAAVLFACGLGWAGYRWLESHVHLKTALSLPAGSDMDDVKNRIATDKAKAAVGIVVLAVALSPLLAGCGAARQTPRHIATSAETSFKTAVIGFGQAEKALYESKALPALTLEVHKSINAKLVKIDDAGIALTQVLLAWPEGAPTPAELRIIVTNVKALVDEVGAVLPDSPQKAKLLGFLSAAEGWLLAIIAPLQPTHPDAAFLVAQLES